MAVVVGEVGLDVGLITIAVTGSRNKDLWLMLRATCSRKTNRTVKNVNEVVILSGPMSAFEAAQVSLVLHPSVVLHVFVAEVVFDAVVGRRQRSSNVCLDSVWRAV